MFETHAWSNNGGIEEKIVEISCYAGIGEKVSVKAVQKAAAGIAKWKYT